MRLRTVIFVLLSGVLAYGVFHVVSFSWRWEQFKTLRQQQLATIEKLEDFPPPGIRDNAWKNELITLYNVWGNVLYIPESATRREMVQLQEKLDEIISETTNANSFESVNRVFGLLLDRNRSKEQEFVLRYQKAFEEYHRSYLPESK